MSSPQKKWYQRIGCLIPIILILLLISFILIGGWMTSNRATYYASGEDFRIDDLPPTAHDVRLEQQTFTAPAYEFKCSETDYRNWVSSTRKKHPKLSIIRDEEIGYCVTISRAGVLDNQKLSNILISDWTFEDQGFYLVYDKKTTRAIRWSHSR